MSRKKTYKYLKRKLERFHHYVYPRIEPQRAEVRVDLGENTATVYVGDMQFELKSYFDGELKHEVYDFALYGALAVALTKNLVLHCDLPVSRSGAESLESVCHVMTILNHNDMYVQPIHLTNIVDDPIVSSSRSGMMCMSGGADSTYAGLLTHKEKHYSHGMLMAGADYPSVDAPGFIDLRKRVSAICDSFDMSLIVVDTTIRQLKVNWNMTHALCLTMALQFHSMYFDKGAIAADFTPLEEISVGPWGNCAPILNALSTPPFPMAYVGGAVSRGEKLKALWESCPDVLQEVSVCFTDKSVGGNCGECRKCLTTMVSLYAAGAEYKRYFITDKELLTLLKNPLPLPDSQTFLRLLTGWYIEDEKRLPEGEIKEVVRAYIQEIKALTIPLGDR